MKVLILTLLCYTIYLNSKQTDYLRNATKMKLSKEITSQLSINIVCSYIFTLFIGLLIIFVLKSFF
jgi:capsular polysaccharide biosynthesis protein